MNTQLSNFVKQFNPPCIIKFAAEEIDGREVVSIWEIRHCAIMMGKKFRLVDELDIMDKYAHEFGHNIGLDHQFVDPYNLPRTVNASDQRFFIQNENRYVGIDDVMIKNHAARNPIVGRYLSPLSRYVLEPINGYEDDDHFGQVYNSLYTQEILEENERRACKK